MRLVGAGAGIALVTLVALRAGIALRPLVIPVSPLSPLSPFAPFAPLSPLAPLVYVAPLTADFGLGFGLPFVDALATEATRASTIATIMNTRPCRRRDVP